MIEILNKSLLIFILCANLYACFSTSGCTASDELPENAEIHRNEGNWVKVSEQRIQFSVPATLQREKLDAIDSFAFRYSDEEISITVEAGIGSESLLPVERSGSTKTFEKNQMEIGGIPGVRADYQYFESKANFQDPNRPYGIMVGLDCKNENDSVSFRIAYSEPRLKDTAEKILKSVSVKCFDIK